MEIKYLVGIDFGHGETTASFFNLNKQKKENEKTDFSELVDRLNIKDADSDEGKKVESCIFFNEITNKWDFPRNNKDFGNVSLTTDLKAPIYELNKKNNKRVAFEEFIKLVFIHIMKHNSELKYCAPNERNFFLCIACPSGWGKSDPKEIRKYGDFFRQIQVPMKWDEKQPNVMVNIPVEWVIKESDAAFFKFNNVAKGKSVLVIDYGSSTIDITYYNKEGIADCGPWGFAKGACRVEKEIIKYITEKYPETKKAITDLKMLINEKEKDDNKLGVNNVIVHYSKMNKEHYYENGDVIIYLDLKSSFIYSSANGRIFDGIEISNAELEIALKNYRMELEDILREVASQVQPQIVILTGGASRMPWFYDLAKEVFTSAEKITRDNNPSYVVSDGIVAYAYAKYKFDREFDKFAREIQGQFTDDVLKKYLDEAFTKGSMLFFLPELKKVLDKWACGHLRNYSNEVTLAYLVYSVNQINKNIIADNSEKILEKMNAEFNNVICNLLREGIDKIAMSVYGSKFRYNCSLSINYDFKNSSFGEEFDADMIERIRNKSDIFWDFLGMNKMGSNHSNELDKCKKFADLYYKEYESIHCTLSASTHAAMLPVVRNELNRILEEIREKGPFAIYR